MLLAIKSYRSFHVVFVVFGSKTADFGLFLYKTHAFTHFFKVSGKKPELPERNAHQQHHHGPNEGNQQYVHRNIQPGRFNTEQRHDPLAHKTG